MHRTEVQHHANTRKQRGLLNSFENISWFVRKWVQELDIILLKLITSKATRATSKNGKSLP